MVIVYYISFYRQKSILLSRFLHFSPKKSKFLIIFLFSIRKPNIGSSLSFIFGVCTAKKNIMYGCNDFCIKTLSSHIWILNFLNQSFSIYIYMLDFSRRLARLLPHLQWRWRCTFSERLDKRIWLVEGVARVSFCQLLFSMGYYSPAEYSGGYYSHTE